MSFYKTLKVFTTLFLLATFFFFFGKFTIAKYLEGDVQVVRSRTRHPEGLPLPGITVCRMGGYAGWKHNSSKAITNPMEKFCGNADKNMTQMLECVAEGTFTLQETVTQTSKWVDETTNVPLNESGWTSDLTLTTMGLCHTLVSEEALFGPLMLLLEEAEQYKILIHDPSFNIMRFNSHLIPSLWLNNPRGTDYFLLATDHVKMNRPESPCEEDPTYNFTVCVKAGLARTIGCRLPWDPVPGPSVATCSSKYQLALYERFYFGLGYATSDIELFSMTGCRLPCKYAEHLSISVLSLTPAPQVPAVHPDREHGPVQRSEY
jgi:hypothetical protein